MYLQWPRSNPVNIKSLYKLSLPHLQHQHNSIHGSTKSTLPMSDPYYVYWPGMETLPRRHYIGGINGGRGHYQMTARQPRPNNKTPLQLDSTWAPLVTSTTSSLCLAGITVSQSRRMSIPPGWIRIVACRVVVARYVDATGEVAGPWRSTCFICMA